MTTTEETAVGASKYPECEKLSDPAYGTLVEFLEELSAKGMFVASYRQDTRTPLVHTHNHINLIYDFLGVDPAALEAERREMLRSLAG